MKKQLQILTLIGIINYVNANEANLQIFNKTMVISFVNYTSNDISYKAIKEQAGDIYQSTHWDYNINGNMQSLNNSELTIYIPPYSSTTISLWNKAILNGKIITLCSSNSNYSCKDFENSLFAYFPRVYGDEILLRGFATDNYKWDEPIQYLSTKSNLSIDLTRIESNRTDWTVKILR